MTNGRDVTTEQLATFEVGGLLVGLDVLRVQEVITGVAVTPVPRAPDAVLGLVNLRGRILAVTDARRRLHLPAADAGSPCVQVVVRTAARLDAIVVDAEGDVLEVDTAEREPVPDTVDPAIRSVATGVHPLPDRLLLAVDVDRLLASDGDEGQVDRAGAGG